MLGAGTTAGAASPAAAAAVVAVVFVVIVAVAAATARTLSKCINTEKNLLHTLLNCIHKCNRIRVT